MTILVLGATGKTGAHLTTALAEAGVDHVAGARRPDELGGPAVRFDWDDPSSWDAALRGVDALYLVKPPVEPVEPVHALLDRAHDVRHVVLLSEMGRAAKSADDPERAVELLVEGGPWQSTLLRPSWFVQNWGPGGGWGEEVRATGRIVLPGTAGFSLVDARDVADVAAAALTSGAGLGCVTVTGPESITLSDLADRITVASGREVEHVSPTLAESRAALVAAGLPTPRIEYLMDLETDAAAGVVAPVHDDVRAVLGRLPRTVDAYVDEHASYWAEGTTR